MKIDRMNKGEWGKLRAFFDIRTKEGFVIKGFKIVDGIKGLFVGMPSQKGNDGEFYNSVWASDELLTELNQLAINEYNTQTGNPMQPNNTPINSEPEKEEINETVSPDQMDVDNNNDKNIVQPFSEEDIPF